MDGIQINEIWPGLFHLPNLRSLQNRNLSHFSDIKSQRVEACDDPGFEFQHLVLTAGRQIGQRSTLRDLRKAREALREALK